jgi:hypothetical protein
MTIPLDPLLKRLAPAWPIGASDEEFRRILQHDTRSNARSFVSSLNSWAPRAGQGYLA